MNTKRQTIWLVSMLSIMVVLSAYYLFTDDVNELNVASDELSTEDIVVDSVGTSGQLIDEIWMNDQIGQLEEEAAADQSKTDEEILQEVQAQQESGYGFFTSLHLQRDEDFSKKSQDLLSVIANGNSEAQTQAWAEFNEIEEMETKLTHLEDLLRQDFENAIITEEEDMWKVIVQTDTMEKSQAVSIIEMVMAEMEAELGQVVVQFRP